MLRFPESKPEPKIVVLGSSGLIGSAVTAALARRPVRLRAVARRRTAIPSVRAGEVEVHSADLTDPERLREVVADADVLFHLVKDSAGWRTAEEDPGCERVTVGVLRNLVEVLRSRRSAGPPPLVLHSGAASQAGVLDEPADGSQPDRPGSVYDRHKLAAERLLMAATAEGVLRGISLRLPTVYGPDPAPDVPDLGVISTMIRRALNGAELPLWHSGIVRRDLLHVADVAAAFMAALDHADALVGGHWVIGSGQGWDLADAFERVAATVAERTGSDPVPVRRVPPPAHTPITDFTSLTVDPAAFRTITGWEPRLPFAEGLRHTVAVMHRRAVAGPKKVPVAEGKQMYGTEASEIYDVVYTLRGKDYAAESKQIAELVRARNPRASSLLDVACGTGGHLVYFDELFGEAEGLELSEEMLEIGRERLPGIPMHHGDMREFDLGRRFDVVVCMFASISHVGGEEEMARTVRRFAAHLNPGGVVAIDPWWFPDNFIDGYVSSDVLTPDERTIARISHAWREGDQSKMDVHYVVASPEGGARHFHERYQYQLFSREQYENALRAAGFTVEYIEGVQYGPGLFVGVLQGEGE
ncbi:NAD-dependent epimerase/dehydratase family protein [Amycolatopsis sp. TNS106]|uniref:NAD-dependent epimerase/dehydratase family protein n=1 Tax=Amycolatopsis sp. TNS106 TaxID=2861750 RepID=UPI00210201F7|nr:NAD-dependent epimerase/dehydratase family protein [Amycolatopsis sp. TNS106]